MRLFMFFINLILWLWIFLVPTALLGLLAFILYDKSEKNLSYSIAISIVGVFLGIAWAERIRKKPGLTRFFGRTQGNSADME